MYNRVLLIGSKDIGFNLLQQMYKAAPQNFVGCVTFDDSSDTRSRYGDIKKYCLKEGILVDVLEKSCNLKKSIEKYKPDICFVAGWYYLIPMDVISMVQGGFIGIHNSLLPSYRGFAPVVWAMINGEEKTGFSVFSLGDGVDTGDIWYQKEIIIGHKDHIGDVLEKINEQIFVFFEKEYLNILEGKIIPYKQKNENISYGAKRNHTDGLIDWSQNAIKVYNFIRAQSKPYPGAYFFYKDVKIRVWDVELFPFEIYGEAGQVGMIDAVRREVVVVCGNNTRIILKEVEIEDRIVKITECIKSLNDRVNSK